MTTDGGRTILVVEDNPSQQNIFRLLLPRYGFEYLIVETGQAAIDSIACCATCFSAIIMDIRLSDMDGYECTRQLRSIEAAKNRRTPIIAVTALALPGDSQKAFDAGMDDYVSKPFAVDDLRRVLLRWTYDDTRPNLLLLPSRSEDLESN